MAKINADENFLCMRYSSGITLSNHKKTYQQEVPYMYYQMMRHLQQSPVLFYYHLYLLPLHK